MAAALCQEGIFSVLRKQVQPPGLAASLAAALDNLTLDNRDICEPTFSLKDTQFTQFKHKLFSRVFSV